MESIPWLSNQEGCRGREERGGENKKAEKLVAPVAVAEFSMTGGSLPSHGPGERGSSPHATSQANSLVFSYSLSIVFMCATQALCH